MCSSDLFIAYAEEEKNCGLAEEDKEERAQEEEEEEEEETHAAPSIPSNCWLVWQQLQCCRGDSVGRTCQTKKGGRIPKGGAVQPSGPVRCAAGISRSGRGARRVGR